MHTAQYMLGKRQVLSADLKEVAESMNETEKISFLSEVSSVHANMSTTCKVMVSDYPVVMFRSDIDNEGESNKWTFSNMT